MPRRPQPLEEDSLEQNCPLCGLPDSSQMVSCEECQRWFHFVCANVSDALADYDWSCQRCRSARFPAPVPTASFSMPPVHIPAVESETQSLVPPLVSLPPGGPSTSYEAPVCECPTSQAYVPPVSQTTSTYNRAYDPRYTCGSHVYFPQIEPIMTTAPSVPTLQPNPVSQMPMDLRLRYLEEEQALERRHLLQRYRLLMDAPQVEPPITTIPLVGLHSSDSAHPTSQHQSFPDFPRVHIVQSPPAPVFPNPQYHSSPVQNPRRSSRPLQTGISSQFQPSPVQQTRPSIPGFRNEDHLQATGFGNESALLNRSQIAARQAVSKDLPEYNGDPEQWPLFIATFDSTTRICGYTPEENMIRLQKCLKGKALEAVRCQLLHPRNLENVLATLKMLFGRPEIIVHSLIQKIQLLPAPKAEKLGTLVDFAIAVRNMVATVQNCDLEEHLCNISLLQSLVDRLPPMIRLNWATHRQNLYRVTLSQFSDWLYNLAEAASSVTIPQIQSVPEKPRHARKDDGFLNAHTETAPKPEVDSNGLINSSTCAVCQGKCEAVEYCKQFLILDHPSRWNTIREYKLCRCCLGKHQGPCKFTKMCGKNGCTFKHHRLLHNDAKDKHYSPTSTSEPKSGPSHQNAAEHTCNTHRGNSNSVLFQYIPVTLHNKGARINTFAFLDCGSSLTLLEEGLASELQLQGEKHPLCLRWTADTCRYEDAAMRVSLEISGTRNEKVKHRLADVYTVKELKLPSQSLPFEELSTKHAYLQGIPVDSYTNMQPRILIGMNNIRVVHPLESREGAEHEPIAAKTRLGWMVYGTCPSGGRACSNTAPHSFHMCHHSSEADVELNSVVKDHFALENLGIAKLEKLLLSTEDERSAKMMRSVTKFENGRFRTGLLWKFDDIRLPDSRPMALRRHHCLMKRMERDSSLAETLRAKMDDYMQKGYVRKLSPEELREPKDRIWYLPIFPVFNPNKPNKVRIVWDAAATVGGVSLNSVLMKGPDLLTALPFVLYRFRERPIAVSGDIAEMFLRMLMNPLDQHCQRIFWCNRDGTTGEYVVTVMTFGAKCSPSCAQFIINENAARFAVQFPEAVEIIKKGHYVDDMLVSVDTEEEAIKLAKDIHYIHLQGGFTMRNWISNSPSVVQALGETGTAEKSLDVNNEAVLEKVLGMWWDTKTDTFRYKLSTERNQELISGLKHPTKRDVLRVMMSVYDPLGLISHYMVYLKLLFQEIWREGSSWDDEIGVRQLMKWKNWLQLLPEAESVRVPRCYHLSYSRGRERTVELHTFVDASELGYAAVCYFRFIEGDKISCSLVGSKSRVAPIKSLSIPRLELQAAVIGTRLARSVEDGHSIKIDRRIFWTDARDVMCWLKSDHRKYSQFVAFRVGEILEATDIGEWRWIRGKINVADEGTKWDRLPSFDISCRWFAGPPFLSKPRSEWPEASINEETAEELRPRLLHHHTQIAGDFLRPENYSNLSHLQRLTALVQRFPVNLQRKLKGEKLLRGPLTSEELLAADNYLYKRAQWACYQDEMATLSAGKPNLPKTSSLFKVSPFIDGAGVMRIHSRIDVCDFADEKTQFPIVLPRRNPLTNLVLQNVHEKYHHQCNETFVNEARKKFNIPRVRVECDRVRRECSRCKIRRAEPDPPMMANLPKERLAAFVRPFSYVGVDYFGPYQVTVGRRSEKRYGVLVTCLTTRAIHIEIAHSLSTDSCIMALRNCFSRRGTPLQIISDRGTNFVGASKELMEALANVDNNKIMAEFTTASTSWSFNPPASPHMGGIWERMIQTVKKVLAEIKPKRLPTDEVLKNLMAEIENVVNSRPLTHVPVDDESSPALTPNHFLVGSSNGSKPLVPYDDSALAMRQSWKTSQILANYFWKRWVLEYTPVITRRARWFNPVKPIAVGNIVIVVDPSFPRNCWPKGRVVAVKTSKDGQVRSATVQTASGIYDRPAVKLAVLDIGTNQSMLNQGPTTGGECCERPSSVSLPPNQHFGTN
ncbi:uncharacterized protein LOC135713357 [Ochlerotatus camptorhynchus]|uniref:uncharacterized protein LOC135713357 n=1 Tax=Ochlerotatus camptorhynchus TaxID=644619 RepID=UPI0031D7B940